MDSLNFFFGLKAVRTPYISDIPISETVTGNMSINGTTQKVATLEKELLKEEQVSLINLKERSVNDLNGSNRAINGSLGEKSF